MVAAVVEIVVGLSGLVEQATCPLDMRVDRHADHDDVVLGDGSRHLSDDVGMERRLLLGDVVGGSRTFEVLLVAEDSGRLEVPAVELSYFDPKKGAYETIK